MTPYEKSALSLYANANQLQSSMGGYMLMFDTLLRLSGAGQQAYLRAEYETEYQTLEELQRILIGMRALFHKRKNAAEEAMHAFFNALMDETGRFAGYDDRNDYYEALFELIDLQHNNWKSVSGRE